MKVGTAKSSNLVQNWLPWQRPLSDRKANERLMMPSNTPTNPENLVKISEVKSEITG